MQSYLAEHIRNHVKAVIIPLRADFVQGVRTELVKPGTVERVVILVDGTAPRKASQRLQVWILLQVVRIAVAEKNLVPVAELVIEAAGCLILARIEGKESAVPFKLAGKERIPRGLTRTQTRSRRYGQSAGQRGGTIGSRDSRLPSKASHIRTYLIV